MTTEVASAEGAAALVNSSASPYRSSWMDALVDLVERAPGPTWLAYLVITLGVIGYFHVGFVVAGFAFDEATLARYGYVAIWVFPLAAYHFLSRGAGGAWDSFRPATRVTDAEAARIRLELSTTPFVPVAVIWIIAALTNAIVSLALPEGFDLLGQPLAYVALRVASESLWVAPVSIVLVYMVVRQLRLVGRLHRAAVDVDLLRPGPLHAMAHLTSRSAIALVIFVVVASLPLPGSSEAAWVASLLLFSLPLLIIAAALFVLPLRGMNQRLVAEKTRQLGAIADRYALASAALHRLVDEEAVGARDPDASRLAQTRIDALNKAIATLLAERDFIRRQSTWPWDGSTFRAVASAIALPVALFLITRLLDRLVF